jgi:hypothetical protein
MYSTTNLFNLFISVWRQNKNFGKGQGSETDNKSNSHTMPLISTNLVISLMNLSPLGRRKEMGAAFLGPVNGARRRRISP